MAGNIEAVTVWFEFVILVTDTVALVPVIGWLKMKFPQATVVVAWFSILAADRYSLQLNFIFTPEAFSVVQDRTEVPPESILSGEAVNETIIGSIVFIPRTRIEKVLP
jgi:hypothetical protein